MCRLSSAGLLWITAVYTSIHSALFCCRTSLVCADYKAECLWLCRVTSCVLFCRTVESKKGLIMLKIGIFFSPPLHQIVPLWKIQVMKEKATDSFEPHPALQRQFKHILFFSWAFRGWSADLLWSQVYPTVSHFANVENCKLNPERPDLRFVLCLSNVNIKGPNSAKQGFLERTRRFEQRAILIHSMGSFCFNVHKPKYANKAEC